MRWNEDRGLNLAHERGYGRIGGLNLGHERGHGRIGGLNLGHERYHGIITLRENHMNSIAMNTILRIH